MSSLPFELRSAVRSLVRAPGHATAVVLVVAIGIGATASLFALVDAVLLRDLPFRDPESLVWIWSTRTDRDRAFFSIPDFVDTRERSRALAGFAGLTPWAAVLTGEGEVERLPGARVTADVFDLLGVQAQLGRTLLPSDVAPDAAPVVVLFDRLWRRRFAADPTVVGRTLRLDGEARTVVGVLPRELVLPTVEAELAIPIDLVRDRWHDQRGTNFLRTFGRLAPGASLGALREELAAINAELRDVYPDSNATKTPPRVIPFRDELVGGLRRSLPVLLAAVGLLFLVACANLAGLALARSAVRGRDLVLRRALGAGRVELALPALVEGAVLAGGGALLGLGLALVATRVTTRLPWLALPGLEARIDLRVAGVASLAAFLAVGGLAVWPALAASRRAAGDGLATRGSAAAGRPRRLLVVAETALALVLAVGAGLLAKSYARVLAVDPGFAPAGLASARVLLPTARTGSPGDVVAAFDALLAEVERIPGVTRSGLVTHAPLSGANSRADFTIVGRPAPAPSEVPATQYRWVSPGYFEAAGVTLVAGRPFAAGDRAEAARVVVVDATFAERWWGDASPLGARLQIGDGLIGPEEVEIVGVVGGVRHFQLEEEPLPTLYAPLAQVTPPSVPMVRAVTLIAGSAERSFEPGAFAVPLKGAIRAADPEIAASEHRPFAAFLDAARASRRFDLAVVTAFALAAVLLAACGLWATTALAVAGRRPELAVRGALGARGRDLVLLVLGEAAGVAALGVALGVGGALLAGRALAALLFGVGVGDPAAYATAAASVLGVTVLAAAVPARRASRVAPTAALRGE